MKITPVLSVAAIAILFLPVLPRAQSLGMGYSPYSDYNNRKPEYVRPKDPVIYEIAKEFSVEPAKLGALWEKGYGRAEIIKMLLIAKEGGVSFDAVRDSREKNVRLKRIAKRHNLDYDRIYSQAYEIKSRLESRASQAVEPSTGTLLDGAAKEVVK